VAAKARVIPVFPFATAEALSNRTSRNSDSMPQRSRGSPWLFDRRAIWFVIERIRRSAARVLGDLTTTEPGRRLPGSQRGLRDAWSAGDRKRAAGWRRALRGPDRSDRRRRWSAAGLQLPAFLSFSEML